VVVDVARVDEQRQGLRDAREAGGDHDHRAELAEGAGDGEDDAVRQPPANGRERDPPEGLPSARAERRRRLLLLRSDLVQDRFDLAYDERKGHEDRRDDHAGKPEDDLEARAVQSAEPTVDAPERDQRHAHDDG
jgi:hypothetical protein